MINIVTRFFILGISILAAVAAFGATNVSAASPPQVQTGAAYASQPTSAVLQGYVSDLGGDYTVTVWLQWGVDTSYGYETARMTRNFPGNFSQFVSNLAPNTTWHVRAVAQNSFTTSYGQDVVFTTGQGGSNWNNPNYRSYTAIQTNPATYTFNNQATLNAWLGPGYSGTTYVWFEWGPTTGYGFQSMRLPQNYNSSISQNIAGLSPDTTYHFRAVAQNDNGLVSYGQDMTFYEQGLASSPIYYPIYYPPTVFSSATSVATGEIGDNIVTDYFIIPLMLTIIGGWIIISNPFNLRTYLAGLTRHT